MLNLDALLEELPKCVHSSLDDLTQHHSTIQICTKADQSKTTQLDLELQKRLQELLSKHFPHINNWGEESFFSHLDFGVEQLNQGDHWVIDPLDGTTNFIHQIPFFCTALSLISDGEIIASVTYDPNRRELFHAIKSQGAYFNRNKIVLCDYHPALKDSIAAIDFKRLDRNLSQDIVAQKPFYSQRNFGSSGIEWSWLSINRINVYVHGSQFLWDYAGGLLAVQELGGMATDLHGNPITEVSLEKKSILASLSPRLHEKWLSIIKESKS